MAKPVQITDRKVANALKALEANEEIKGKITTKAAVAAVAGVILPKDTTPTKEERELIHSYLVAIATERAEQDIDEGGEPEEGDNSKVRAKYKKEYAERETKTGCSDEVDVAFHGLTADLESDDLLAKLASIAKANHVPDEQYAKWLKLRNRDGGVNVGMVRMNLSNVLRGKIRRGEKVTLGKKVWAEDKDKLAAAKAKKQAGLEKLKARKANGKTKAAAASKGGKKGSKPPKKPRSGKYGKGGEAPAETPETPAEAA